MSELFQRDISVISRHISNVFQEGELDEERNLHFCKFQIPTSPSDITALMLLYP